MRIEAHGASDTGRVRTRNEDSILVLPDAALFAVADGMGGHAAGDIASALAIATLEEAAGGAPAAGLPIEARLPALIEATHGANRAILAEAGRDPERSGMGTTMTALAVSVAEAAWAIAHVGDSRAYLLRDGRLEQLTTDHTWVQREVEEGRLTPSRARTHPWSNMLTHALGVADEERVDALTGELRVGDLFLLCTDGLTCMLEDGDVERLLDSGGSLAARADALIGAALDAGGIDNVTVVLVRVSD